MSATTRMALMSPVVSFAGPLIRARAALDAAGELLESRKTPEGLEQLREVVSQVNAAVEFIITEEAREQRGR